MAVLERVVSLRRRQGAVLVAAGQVYGGEEREHEHGEPYPPSAPDERGEG